MHTSSGWVKFGFIHLPHLALVHFFVVVVFPPFWTQKLQPCVFASCLLKCSVWSFFVPLQWQTTLVRSDLGQMKLRKKPSFKQISFLNSTACYCARWNSLRSTGVGLIQEAVQMSCVVSPRRAFLFFFSDLHSGLKVFITLQSALPLPGASPRTALQLMGEIWPNRWSCIHGLWEFGFGFFHPACLFFGPILKVESQKKTFSPIRLTNCEPSHELGGVSEELEVVRETCMCLVVTKK